MTLEDNEYVVVLNNEVQDYKAELKTAGLVYLSAPQVADSINHRFYWDEQRKNIYLYNSNPGDQGLPG